jgi:hypothetical protein
MNSKQLLGRDGLMIFNHLLLPRPIKNEMYFG